MTVRPTETVRFYRRVIKITAEHSPNVRLGLEERQRGLVASGDTVIAGVLPLQDYDKRRATWDKIRQCIGLDAEFYEGAENLLFPPEWLNRARLLWRSRNLRDAPMGVGGDPGEGGANTALAVISGKGLLEIESRKTPDTDMVPPMVRAFLNKWSVSPKDTCLDRGGGGKQHADVLRREGCPVRTIAFGESIQLDLRRGAHQLETRKEQREEAYVYFNRRAQMYGELSLLLDPGYNPQGFYLPPESEGPQYERLFRQLSVIPKLYDREGRLRMLPKNKKDPEDKEKTLVELIGHSPDEADALVLAVHAMLHKGLRVKAGVS